MGGPRPGWPPWIRHCWDDATVTGCQDFHESPSTSKWCAIVEVIAAVLSADSSTGPDHRLICSLDKFSRVVGSASLPGDIHRCTMQPLDVVLVWTTVTVARERPVIVSTSGRTERMQSNSHQVADYRRGQMTLDHVEKRRYWKRSIVVGMQLASALHVSYHQRRD